MLHNTKNFLNGFTELCTSPFSFCAINIDDLSHVCLMTYNLPLNVKKYFDTFKHKCTKFFKVKNCLCLILLFRYLVNLL